MKELVHDKEECVGCLYDRLDRCSLRTKARNPKESPKRDSRCRTVIVDSDYVTPKKEKMYHVARISRVKKIDI